MNQDKVDGNGAESKVTTTEKIVKNILQKLGVLWLVDLLTLLSKVHILMFSV